MGYSMRTSKKGGMMSSNPWMIPTFVLALAAVIVTLGVTVVVYGAFNDSLDTDNNASTYVPAQNVFDDASNMAVNFTNQLGTIGTIAGILLLVVLVGLAGLGGYGYGRDKGWF